MCFSKGGILWRFVIKICLIKRSIEVIQIQWQNFLQDLVDPDQLASEEANWSGSALFANQYVNLYKQSGSRNLIEEKLEVGMAS